MGTNENFNSGVENERPTFKSLCSDPLTTVKEIFTFIGIAETIRLTFKAMRKIALAKANKNGPSIETDFVEEPETIDSEE